jgi:hypothetical protein
MRTTISIAPPFELLTFGDGGLAPGETVDSLKRLEDIEAAERLAGQPEGGANGPRD